MPFNWIKGRSSSIFAWPERREGKRERNRPNLCLAHYFWSGLSRESRSLSVTKSLLFADKSERIAHFEAGRQCQRNEKPVSYRATRVILIDLLDKTASWSWQIERRRGSSRAADISRSPPPIPMKRDVETGLDERPDERQRNRKRFHSRRAWNNDVAHNAPAVSYRITSLRNYFLCCNEPITRLPG